jgi:hypothetical protein
MAPSFSLVVASIKFEYALCIVSSIGIKVIVFTPFSSVVDEFVSIVFGRTIAEMVGFSVKGLTRIVVTGSDTSDKSTAFDFGE